MSQDRFRPRSSPEEFRRRYGDWYRFPPRLPPPPPPPPSPSSSGNLSVLTLSILGVLSAAIILLLYCFVNAPGCFCRRRLDALGGSRRRRLRDNLMMMSMGARGLAASEIRRIPTFQYRKESGAAGGGAGDCAVCLGEFQEEETIRLLPDCFHVFHVNCIDTWLQSNANCPLCRATITPAGAAATVPVDRLPAFVRSGGFDQRNRSDEVVIDVKDDEREVERQRELRRQLPASGPMRRSFSVGSAAATGQQLYGEVQKIVRQNPQFQEAAAAAPPAAGGTGEGSSGGGRIRRGLFSFHRRSSSAAAFN